MSKQNTLHILLPLVLLIVIDTMGFGLFMPVLGPLMLNNTGFLAVDTSIAMRNVYYAIVFGAFPVMAFLFAPLLGDWSDRIGRKKVLIISLIGTVFSAVVCGIGIDIGSVGMLIAGRAINGIFAGSQPIAQATILDISAPDKKAVNLSLISMAACLGFTIGPITGGLFSDHHLVHWFTYSTPFYVDGLLALLNAVLVWKTLTETVKTEQQNKLTLNIKRQIDTLLDAFRFKAIRKLSLVYLFYELAWAIYFQFMALFLVEKYAYTSGQIGWFMSFIGFVLGLTFLLLMRWLLKFFSEWQVTLYSLFLCSVSLLLPLVFNSELGQWGSVIFISIGVGLVWNCILTLFSNAVSSEQQGWAMGVAASVSMIAWIPGSIAAAYLNYLSLTLPFFVTSLLMLVAGIILLYNKTNKKISK